MTSPTQKTLKLLRKNGFTAQVIEHWNSFAKRRIDLFGCIDIVAIHPNSIGVLGIQCTAYPNGKSRINKALAQPELNIWMEAKNHFAIYEWKKEELKVSILHNGVFEEV